MDELFELGEHRLANDGAADGVDIAIDQIRPLLFSLGVRHQVPADQLLVERAGDLGDEDGVIVVLEWLMLGRQVAVHRVPRFVGEREDIVQHFGLVVHQNVGIAIERPATERARLFALVRIAITPAAFEALLQHLAVLASKRGERRHNHFHGLVPSVLHVQLGKDRHVGIVMMQRP